MTTVLGQHNGVCTVPIAKSNPDVGTINLRGVTVTIKKRLVSRVTTPQVRVFDEIVDLGHAWGGWGWYRMSELHEAILFSLYRKKCPASQLQDLPYYKSFLCPYLFRPSEVKPFHWLTVQNWQSHGEKEVHLNAGRDAYECQFIWNNSADLYVLAAWGKKVLNLVHEHGVVMINRQDKVLVGTTWRGALIPLNSQSLPTPRMASVN